jgi:hypothetical protein
MGATPAREAIMTPDFSSIIFAATDIVRSIMNHIRFVCLIGFALLLACQAPDTKKEDQSQTVTEAPKANEEGKSSGPAPASGGTAPDAHGCDANEGFLWSEVRKTCIQPWQVGAQFTPSDPRKGGKRVAFVVLSDDRVKAEVFFTGRPPVTLNATLYHRDDPVRILYTNADHSVELRFEKDKFYIAEDGKTSFVQPYSTTAGLGAVLKQY